MDLPSLRDVLAAARQLPPEARIELAEALLREGSAPGKPPAVDVLVGMSDIELRALAGAVLAPGHQRRLRALLRKNREGSLRAAEQAEMDGLLEESDRVALLKARAAYTLSRTVQPPAKAA
jgi:hypothetical protein